MKVTGSDLVPLDMPLHFSCAPEAQNPLRTLEIVGVGLGVRSLESIGPILFMFMLVGGGSLAPRLKGIHRPVLPEARAPC